MQRSNIVALTLACLVSTTAMAETLAQKKAHKDDEKQLNDDLNGPDNGTAAQKVASVNGACGTTMTATFDWPSIDKLAFPPPFAPSQYGHDFLWGVQHFCKLAADNKTAVKDKIHKLVIVYGGGDKKSTFAVAGGTFTYTIGDTKKGSTNDAEVRDYLGSHL
jgi:hypothetical protein